MTAGKLDDIGANVASNSPLPLRVEKLIIGANNRSTSDRGVFGPLSCHMPVLVLVRRRLPVLDFVLIFLGHMRNRVVLRLC